MPVVDLGIGENRAARETLRRKQRNMKKQSNRISGGGEELASNGLFTVIMDADTTRITLFFHRACGPGHQMWLTVTHVEWRKLCRLITGLNPSKRGRKRSVGLGCSEKLAEDSVGLTLGSLTICIPMDNFAKLKETVLAANRGIVKLRVDR